MSRTAWAELRKRGTATHWCLAASVGVPNSEPEGLVKVWAGKRGKSLGASVFGANAGKMIVVHPRAQCILAIINPPHALAKVNSCQFFCFVDSRYSSDWLLFSFSSSTINIAIPSGGFGSSGLKLLDRRRGLPAVGPPDRESERLHPDRAAVPGSRS